MVNLNPILPVVTFFFLPFNVLLNHFVEMSNVARKGQNINFRYQGSKLYIS
jgi:hypothetical protein